MNKNTNAAWIAICISLITSSYASAQVQALEIDSKGNVGINTTQPAAQLHVNGDGIINTTLTVKEKATVEELNVGSQTTTKSLVVTDSTKTDSLTVTTNIAANTLQATASIQAPTIKATGSIQTPTIVVDGSVSASSVNGALKPYSFTVNPSGATTGWYSTQIDSDTIKSYFADEDGGSMRILFRVNSTGEVSIISELIYIYEDAKGTIRGFSRQQGDGGGGAFILNNNAKYEIIPHPWNWLWVRNYHSPETPPLKEGPAFGDYKLEFLCPPNITATVIFYD